MAKKVKYTLFEEGYPHTKGLTLQEAEEMLERHKRIFPNLIWYIMQEPHGVY